MTQPGRPPMSAQDKRLVFASSLGTAFEWYDFYLYGALAVIIAEQFFGGLGAQTSFVFTLLAFAAGFIVRPVGALVFGRLGDLVGRKSTLLVSILVMGLSTFMIGVLPSYAEIGVAAPIMLVALRMLQGFALGGEYGGAVLLVAEHAPDGRRGAYTAWIQATASLGLLASLLVVLGTRSLLGEAAFAAWGWRLPFISSILLLGVSVYIRMHMAESPAFSRLRSQGQTSRAPLRDSFADRCNLKKVLLVLFGLTAGQAVIWYCGQFYALFFLTQTLKVPEVDAQLMLAMALLVGLPFFWWMGAWSDRVGRLPLILGGFVLAALTYFPAFKALTYAANPTLAAAQDRVAVVVTVRLQECSLLGNPLQDAPTLDSACDLARDLLTREAVRYTLAPLPHGETQSVRVGEQRIVLPDFATSSPDAGALRFGTLAEFRQQLTEALRSQGYPAQADLQKLKPLVVVLILSYLVLLVAMVYAPLGALLMEMFPTRIRYTSLSLPYHMGNGWFGGLLPTTVFAIVAQTGDMYAGLWYPVAVVGMSLLVLLVWRRHL